MGADLNRIRSEICQHSYLFTTTCGAKMLKLGLTAEQIEEAICADSPEIIEDYPCDERGPACLVLGWAGQAQPLHVVIGYGSDPDVMIEVVTVYEPDVARWYNYRTRR